MEESVKYHMIADVEVGSFLSSGVDSSYLVSLAKPNKTYTFISNKLDVTFNPIDYILCPDEYYKNE